MIVAFAGCAMLEGAPPPESRVADEERIRQEHRWPSLADVPSEPRPGSSRAAIAALRAQLEAERAAHGAGRDCPERRAGDDGKCME